MVLAGVENACVVDKVASKQAKDTRDDIEAEKATIFNFQLFLKWWSLLAIAVISQRSWIGVCVTQGYDYWEDTLSVFPFRRLGCQWKQTSISFFPRRLETTSTCMRVDTLSRGISTHV